MAITNTPVASKLIIKVQSGTNAAGNPVYKQISFNGLKAAASDSDIYAIGQSLGNLQKLTPFSVLRWDEATIANS